MTPKLLNAEYVGDYRVRLAYEDGTCAVVDLEQELWGEVGEPLKDKTLFRAFWLSEGRETLEWPTGLGFAPEFLYELATA
ncbi:MAG: DUF2442 domain-containing protein [Planctomycetota bacterium]